MELNIAGNQLILSGRVVGDEPGKVTDVLAKHPEIDTVILRNSPGGDAPAGAAATGTVGESAAGRWREAKASRTISSSGRSGAAARATERSTALRSSRTLPGQP